MFIWYNYGKVMNKMFDKTKCPDWYGIYQITADVTDNSKGKYNGDYKVTSIKSCKKIPGVEMSY